MTTDDYFAYVREYQHQLLDAAILARAGLADPTIEEQEELDALYEEDDPFEEQAFVLLVLDGSEQPLACVAEEDEPSREDAEVTLLAGAVATWPKSATVGLKGATHGSF